MKLSLGALSLLSCAAVLFAAAPSTHAQITSATVYLGTPDAGNAGDSANWASTLQSAQFGIGSLGIDFQSTSNYDVNSFLNNPTYTNEQNGFTSTLAGVANSADNLELVITGSTYLNAGSNSFTVGHDDGVVLTLSGLPGGFGNVVDAPGGTSFTTTPFTIDATTAGNYSFVLDYAECCGAPADLLFTVNGAPITTPSPTPEPSSLTLLGTGMLAFAGMARRRFLA